MHTKTVTATVPDFSIVAYQLEWAKVQKGPWRTVSAARTDGLAEIDTTATFPARSGFYRFVWIADGGASKPGAVTAVSPQPEPSVGLPEVQRKKDE